MSSPAGKGHHQPGCPILPGSVFLITSDGRTLRLPIPSPSPSDPLNWSTRKRCWALAAVFFYTILGIVQVQGTSLLLVSLGTEYSAEDMGPFRLDLLASSPSLFMGIGACLWIPLSLALGRRPVFLLCTLILTLATLWAGLSRSFYQHLVAKCLQGLAVGVSVSTVILMVIDLTFIHQRPQVIAVLWSLCAVLSNLFLSPTAAIVRGGGSWRAFYWVWTTPCAVAIFIAVLFCPETYFRRPAVAFDGRVLVQSATEKVTVYEDWGGVPGGKALPDTPQSACRALLKELRVWGPIQQGGWKAMASCYWQVACCIINPLIFWVAILTALSFGGIVSISNTYVTLLSSPPYSLSSDAIALVRLSAALGCLLAWPVSGLLTARICRRLDRRNRGVRDAEHYLPSYVLPILAGAASMGLYGLAGARYWHWIWIYVAHGISAFSFTTLLTANTLWVTEAFPRWAAAAIVAVGGLSYIASFALSFVILPWIRSQGFAKANGEIGLLILGVGLMGIPVGFYGKRARKYIHCRWVDTECGALRPH